MTTHAVSPLTPKIVLAKKSGRGIKMSMITVWQASTHQDQYDTSVGKVTDQGD